MTTVTTRVEKQPRSRIPASITSMAGGRRLLLAGIVLAALLSFVRLVTDEPDITSSGTFGAALRVAIPIGLAGLGALFAERVGIVNIGLEGMMVMGTWFAGWVG